MTEDLTPQLIQAVTQLTETVQSLDSLLREDYPKRTEVERKFVSKLENQKVVTKIIIVALITVLGCYGMTVGVYSQCFIGEESPSACRFVPGYEERVARRDQIDGRIADLQKQIDELEKTETRGTQR